MAPVNNNNSHPNGHVNGNANGDCLRPDKENTVNGTTNGVDGFHFSKLELENIREMHSEFSTERNWNQFHTPRNIMMALVGEVGEVAEHFQWKSDAECQIGLPNWTPEQRNNLGEELADVQIYLTRLADRCQIDLSQAVCDKMAKNAKKYPVNLAFGNAKKYSEL